MFFLPTIIQDLMKPLYFAAVSLVVLTGCGVQQYKVDSSLNYLELMGAPMARLELNSTEDEVTVDSVVINRGQCKDIDNGRNFPFTLKYGEKMSVISERCKVREVTWTINGIEHTFNWDPH